MGREGGGGGAKAAPPAGGKASQEMAKLLKRGKTLYRASRVSAEQYVSPRAKANTLTSLRSVVTQMKRLSRRTGVPLPEWAKGR